MNAPNSGPTVVSGAASAVVQRRCRATARLAIACHCSSRSSAKVAGVAGKRSRAPRASPVRDCDPCTEPAQEPDRSGVVLRAKGEERADPAVVGEDDQPLDETRAECAPLQRRLHARGELGAAGVAQEVVELGRAAQSPVDPAADGKGGLGRAAGGAARPKSAPDRPRDRGGRNGRAARPGPGRRGAGTGRGPRRAGDASQVRSSCAAAIMLRRNMSMSPAAPAVKPWFPTRESSAGGAARRRARRSAELAAQAQTMRGKRRALPPASSASLSATLRASWR